MGLGDMINKLFKKDNGKDSRIAETAGTDKSQIGQSVETSKTEKIYKLQTLDIEEAFNPSSHSHDQASDLELDKDGHQQGSKSDEVTGAPGLSGSAQSAEGPEVNPTPGGKEDIISEAKVFEVLSDIYDPEIPIDIVNLGLVYGVEVNDGVVNVKMTLTSPGCPTAGQMVQEAQLLIEDQPGVKEAIVEVVWDPPWDPSRMSEEAKKALGYL